MIKSFCQILDWDSEFFGFKIAKVQGPCLNDASWKNIHHFCTSRQVKCLYFFTSPSDRESIETAECAGFHLVDIRLTLDLNLDKRFRIPEQNEAMIRQGRAEDLPHLEAIASKSHTDSRFFYDPCFSNELCEKMYKIWIRKSIEGYADMVFVPELDGKPSGYITCSFNSVEKSKSGVIGLMGVSEKVRGRGVGSRLIQRSLSFFQKNHIEYIEVVTQGRNITAQRNYQKNGFRTSRIKLSYHKWFL